MSKKYLIIGTVLLVLVLGAAGGYFLFSRKNFDQAGSSLPDGSFNANQSGVNQKFNDPLVSYQDGSGYSFSYPQTITVKDVTPNDDNYYSALELSRDGKTMKVNITVGNIDPYKTNKSAALVGSTTLAGITANQYSLAGNLVTVAIDQGVLYVLDGPKDAGFWEDAQGKIVSSFKFAGQSATSDSGSSDVNTTYEEETVQ